MVERRTGVAAIELDIERRSVISGYQLREWRLVDDQPRDRIRVRGGELEADERADARRKHRGGSGVEVVEDAVDVVGVDGDARRLRGIIEPAARVGAAG